jgi:hypothetical protein
LRLQPRSTFANQASTSRRTDYAYVEACLRRLLFARAELAQRDLLANTLHAEHQGAHQLRILCIGVNAAAFEQAIEAARRERIVEVEDTARQL